MFRALAELYRYRGLVRHLVILDLKVRYRGSFLGFFWTLLNPLLLTLVMWLVFSNFRRIDEPNYALFLLAGLMSWNFFSQSITRSLTAIISNRSLLQKIYLPKIVFPISIVTSNLVNLAFFVAAYLVIAAIFYEVHLSALGLLLPVSMLYLMSTGAAMLMCSLNVFFRDFTHLTDVILRALFYLTPILYPPDLFGPRALFFLRLNPIYYPIVGINEVLYRGVFGPLDFWIVGFAASLILFCLGLAVFTGTQNKFLYYA